MEKKTYVLWKWDNQVYEVIEETEGFYTIKDIKFGYIFKVEKEKVIVINNM